ncbi:hypothetical protein AgCh_023585 [Apium graveolens]
MRRVGPTWGTTPATSAEWGPHGGPPSAMPAEWAHMGDHTCHISGVGPTSWDTSATNYTMASCQTYSAHDFVVKIIRWPVAKPILLMISLSRDDSPWGSTFLNLEEMQNPIKLLIERQPWHVNDIGIPHPTYFHPHSDEDIISWQFKIIQSSRNNLVSFAGGARPDSPDSIRSVLINQCTLASTGTCKFQNCSSGGCDQPESIIKLFFESEFCLQPLGDSPTRKSVFDSLISGCIPVFFGPFTTYYQYSWHFPEDHGKYSIFID